MNTELTRITHTAAVSCIDSDAVCMFRPSWQGPFGNSSCTSPPSALRMLCVLQAEAEDAEVRRALRAAEADAVAGMPPPPASLQELLPEQCAFRLQRVECTCAAHASLRQQLLARLQVLQDRLTADEQDEVCPSDPRMACWCGCHRSK